MLKQKPLNMNAVRSINLVVEAMLNLMNVKPYKKISISEITKEAGIVRSTFYSHFENKEDILSYYIYNTFASKLSDIQNNATDIVIVYFQIWSEQLDFLELLRKNDLLNILYHFETHLEFFCFEDHLLDKKCKFTNTATSYATSIYAHSMASILKRWIETGMNEKPIELASIFHEVVN